MDEDVAVVVMVEDDYDVWWWVHLTLSICAMNSHTLYIIITIIIVNTNMPLFHYYYYCYSFCCCLCVHPSIVSFFYRNIRRHKCVCVRSCVCDPHLTHTFATNSTSKACISIESERSHIACACQTVQLSRAVQTGMFSSVLTFRRRTTFRTCIIAHKCQIHYTALFPIYRSHSLRRTQ